MKKTAGKTVKKAKMPTSNINNQTGKIIDIDDEVSITADKYQYIVITNRHRTYHTSLEDCFQHIFRFKIKTNLVANPEKNIERIVEIHKETAAWLKKIFRSTEYPSF